MSLWLSVKSVRINNTLMQNYIEIKSLQTRYTAGKYFILLISYIAYIYCKLMKYKATTELRGQNSEDCNRLKSSTEILYDTGRKLW